MKRNLITILIGFLVAALSWAPLWIIEARDPYAMPVQLGLLTFAVSFAGGVIAFVGLVRLAVGLARTARKAP